MPDVIQGMANREINITNLSEGRDRLYAISDQLTKLGGQDQEINKINTAISNMAILIADLNEKAGELSSDTMSKLIDTISAFVNSTRELTDINSIDAWKSAITDATDTVSKNIDELAETWYKSMDTADTAASKIISSMEEYSSTLDTMAAKNEKLSSTMRDGADAFDDNSEALQRQHEEIKKLILGQQDLVQSANDVIVSSARISEAQKDVDASVHMVDESLERIKNHMQGNSQFDDMVRQLQSARAELDQLKAAIENNADLVSKSNGVEIGSNGQLTITNQAGSDAVEKLAESQTQYIQRSELFRVMATQITEAASSVELAAQAFGKSDIASLSQTVDSVIETTQSAIKNYNSNIANASRAISQDQTPIQASNIDSNIMDNLMILQNMAAGRGMGKGMSDAIDDTNKYAAGAYQQAILMHENGEMNTEQFSHISESLKSIADLSKKLTESESELGALFQKAEDLRGQLSEAKKIKNPTAKQQEKQSALNIELMSTMQKIYERYSTHAGTQQQINRSLKGVQDIMPNLKGNSAYAKQFADDFQKLISEAIKSTDLAIVFKEVLKIDYDVDPMKQLNDELKQMKDNAKDAANNLKDAANGVKSFISGARNAINSVEGLGKEAFERTLNPLKNTPIVGAGLGLMSGLGVSGMIYDNAQIAKMANDYYLERGKQRFQTGQTDLLYGVDLNTSFNNTYGRQELGLHLYEASGGMIDKSAVVNAYNSAMRNVGGGYGLSGEQGAADINELVNKTSMIQNVYGIDQNTMNDAYSTYYKEMRMSASEAADAIARVTQVAQSSGVPLQKYLQLTSGLAKSFLKIGLDGNAAVNMMGNLMNQGMRAEVAQTITSNVGSAMNSWGDNGTNAAFAGVLMGQDPFEAMREARDMHDPNRAQKVAKQIDTTVDLYSGLSDDKNISWNTVYDMLKQKGFNGWAASYIANAKMDEGMDGGRLEDLIKEVEAKGGTKSIDQINGELNQKLGELTEALPAQAQNTAKLTKQILDLNETIGGTFDELSNSIQKTLSENVKNAASSIQTAINGLKEFMTSSTANWLAENAKLVNQIGLFATAISMAASAVATVGGLNLGKGLGSLKGGAGKAAQFLSKLLPEGGLGGISAVGAATWGAIASLPLAAYLSYKEKSEAFEKAGGSALKAFNIDASGESDEIFTNDNIGEESKEIEKKEEEAKKEEEDAKKEAENIANGDSENSSEGGTPGETTDAVEEGTNKADTNSQKTQNILEASRKNNREQNEALLKQLEGESDKELKMLAEIKTSMENGIKEITEAIKNIKAVGTGRGSNGTVIPTSSSSRLYGSSYSQLSAEIKQYVDKAAQQTGVDKEQIAAHIMAESSGDKNAVSEAGAIGLMQLMPETAESIGVDPNNPEQNVLGGALYLKSQAQNFKDARLQAAAYNAGGTAVRELVQQYGEDYDKIAPHLPAETRNYVEKIYGRGSGSVSTPAAGGSPASSAGSSGSGSGAASTPRSSGNAPLTEREMQWMMYSDDCTYASIANFMNLNGGDYTTEQMHNMYDAVDVIETPRSLGLNLEEYQNVSGNEFINILKQHGNALAYMENTKNDYLSAYSGTHATTVQLTGDNEATVYDPAGRRLVVSLDELANSINESGSISWVAGSNSGRSDISLLGEDADIALDAGSSSSASSSSSSSSEKSGPGKGILNVNAYDVRAGTGMIMHRLKEFGGYGSNTSNINTSGYDLAKLVAAGGVDEIQNNLRAEHQKNLRAFQQFNPISNGKFINADISMPGIEEEQKENPSDFANKYSNTFSEFSEAVQEAAKNNVTNEVHITGLPDSLITMIKQVIEDYCTQNGFQAPSINTAATDGD